MSRILDWIDDRTGYRGLLHAAVLLNFPVTRAASWRFVWGGSLALMFFVELVTGTLLMTVYSPSEAAAWGSVQYLESQTQFGTVVRGIHHYTSHMMLVVMVIHLVVLVLTAGYRRPKEFTYWTGLVLAVLVIGLAISGNPLPWDQKGYQAYQIETSIAGTMPYVGPTLRTLLVGGAEFGNLTLTRLYTLHVVVLPFLATLLLTLHFALVRREKLLLNRQLAEQAGAGAAVPESQPYWPFQVGRNLIAFFALMTVVFFQFAVLPRLGESSLVSIVDGAPLELKRHEVVLQAPADPGWPYVARPEWYVRPLFELRHMVSRDQEILITGALPVVVGILLLLVPFYESVLGRTGGHGLAVLVVLTLVLGSAWVTWTGYRRDATDPEFQESRRRELELATRAAYLARENGIPPEGPVALLQTDVRARGPVLFAEHCATCHTWNGHDGTGRVTIDLIDGVKQPMVPTAPDLAGFGTRDWIASFLANPAGDKFFGGAHQLKGGLRLKEGEMTRWAAESLAPSGPLTEEHLRGVAALLARESGRVDDGPFDDAEIQRGIEVFNGDVLDSKGEPVEFAQCLQCHSLKAGDPDGVGNGGMSPAPELDGYASADWIRAFIRDPGSARFYGKKNVMPAFDAGRLPERELELLVRWMRREWQGK